MPEETSLGDESQGVRIVRVWMQVAGAMREAPQSIMPDPNDPERWVVVTVDPDTKELVPQRRRGIVQCVEQGQDGVWRFVDEVDRCLSHVVERVRAIYESAGDLKKARSRAELFLARRLRRLFPRLSAAGLSDLRRRSAMELDRIEQDVLGKRRSSERQQDSAEATQSEPQRDQESQPAAQEAPQKGNEMGDILSQDEVDALLVAADEYDRLMQSPAYARLAQAVFPEDPPKKEMGALLVSLDGLLGEELPEEQLEIDLERRLKSMRKNLSDLGVSDARLLELPGAVRQALSARRAELPCKPDPRGSAVVSGYDFKHPARVNKDQLRTLENLHDNFARLLSSTFSGAMRAVVDVDTAFVDQTTYAEFIMSLSNPSCSYQFTLGPTNGQAIIDFAMPVTFAFVDRIFGGKGSSQGVDARQMSQIEMGVIAKIVKRVIEDLEATWEPILRVEISDIELETNPEFMQITAASEIVILLAFEVNSTNASGLLSLCYPFYTLESILPRLGQQTYVRSRTGNRQALLQQNRAVLGPVKVPLVAELGRAELTMAEVSSLGVGDVICSTSRRADPAIVFAGGEPKYYARPFADEDGQIRMEIAGSIPRELQAHHPSHDQHPTPGP